jgi:hypothetical protein
MPFMSAARTPRVPAAPDDRDDNGGHGSDHGQRVCAAPRGAISHGMSVIGRPWPGARRPALGLYGGWAAWRLELW